MEQMAIAVGHKWKSFHNKEEYLSGLDSLAPSTDKLQELLREYTRRGDKRRA